MTTIMEGAQDRIVREHNTNAWLAFHIVALTRSKKLPKLESLLATATKPAARRRQTWQEQMAVMEQWASVRRRVDRQQSKMNGD